MEKFAKELQKKFEKESKPKIQEFNMIRSTRTFDNEIDTKETQSKTLETTVPLKEIKEIEDSEDYVENSDHDLEKAEQ